MSEKEIIERFKNEMMFWGIDLSDFNDEEILRGVGNFKELIKGFISSDDAANSLFLLAKGGISLDEVVL